MRGRLEINLDNFPVYFVNMTCFLELYCYLDQPMSYFCKFSFNFPKMYHSKDWGWV